MSTTAFPKQREVLTAIRETGAINSAADKLGIHPSAFRRGLKANGLWDAARKARDEAKKSDPAIRAKVIGERGSVEYPADGDVVAVATVEKSLAATARHFGLSESSFKSYLDRSPELRGRVTEAIKAAKRSNGGSAQLPPAEAAAFLSEAVHEHLTKAGEKAHLDVGSISDALDIPPSRVRQALEYLRAKGIRIPDEAEGSIALQKVYPDDAGSVHRSLLEGQELTIGLVSDTHLSSKEEALPELNLAYDIFEERGITEVWNPGDLTCGLGIYRTQNSEIKNHTYDDQVDYLEEFYPVREGIVTRAIGGNHDLEGEFGKMGADPVKALANRRSDIDYLGPYSAHIELPGGSFAHLLHGSGGMSYSYSYKAQKLVDGYSAGRKPAILCVGHWHVAGYLLQRNVNVMFPGCFEWESPYLKRKGLSPAVGFWVLKVTIGDDGSVVKFNPEWNQFFEGRVHKP